MKRILIWANNGCGLRDDHYDFFRSEGRFVINIGVGLSLLGFNVEIKSDKFKPQRISSTLQLVNAPFGHYDYAIIFSNLSWIKNVDASTFFLMEHRLHQISSLVSEFESLCPNRKFVVVCPYKGLLNKKWDREVKYFPTVFPCPDFSTDFLPFSSLNRKDIRIFTQIGVNVSSMSADEIFQVKCVVDTFRLLGYVPQYRIQTQHKQVINVFKMSGEKVEFLPRFVSYKDLYLHLKECDIVLCFTNPGSAGGSQFDAIAMGKAPLFFSFPYTLSNNISVSPFFLDSSNIICIDRNTKTDKVAESILYKLENLEEYYNKLVETIKDCRFKNWEEIVLPFFE